MLGTIRRIPDELWMEIQRLLPPEKPLGTNGRPVVPFRKVLDGKKGFIRANWCGSDDCETKIREETGASVRLIKLEREDTFGKCVYCGKDAKEVAYFAKDY